MKINLNPVSPKKMILSFIMMLVLNRGAAQAQPQQGLMSRLIEIKYSTELYLTTQIKNETNPAKKDSVDQENLISQLYDNQYFIKYH